MPVVGKRNVQAGTSDYRKHGNGYFELRIEKSVSPSIAF